MPIKRSAVFVLLDDENVLMEYRTNPDKIYYQQWIFPGGFINDGELTDDGMMREVREELGVHVIHYYPCYMSYKFFSNGMWVYPFVVLRWHGKIPEKILDTQNPIAWYHINDTINLQNEGTRKVAEFVIEYLESVK